MAQYTGMILTKKGRDLQAKAEAGATLTFTKAKIGDGQLGQGQSLENLNDLISPQKTLTISSVQAESGGLCRIRTNITNQGITQGFYVREIGLFAQDPDLGEILYAISTASAADYLPPEGGATIVNNQFDIIVIVGNASSISATINPSGLVNQEQLANLQGQVDSLAKNVIGSAVVTGLAFTVAGLTASYTAGTAYVSGVKFDVAAGSIQLNANQGQYIYLDTDGKVKGTTDQATAQAKCLLWYFTTNATNVLTSTDRRSVIDSTQFVKQSEMSQYAKKAGETFTGAVNMDGGGQVLNLKPGTADHAYMGIYAETQAPTIRSGYIGYPNAGNTTLTVGNDMSGGNVALTPGAGGRVVLNGDTNMGGRMIYGIKDLCFANATKLSETAGTRTALNAESNRFDVITSDGNKYIATMNGMTGSLQFMSFDLLGGNKVVRSGKDANGIFTQVDYYRVDEATLFQRSKLSGMPDANGNYPTVTLTRYADDGVTVIGTLSYNITYDADGDYTLVT